jgi:predicted ArsR family transcriptional regulator
VALEEPLSRAAAAVLTALRAAKEPLSLLGLSAETGLHPNTLRDHLEVLVAAGLARRRRAQPQGRGRPAWLYSAGGRGAGSAVTEYAGLVGVLAELVSRTSDRPWDAAVDVGAGWGRRLAEDRDRSEAPHQVVVELLEDLRFSPEAAGAQVRLTRCPLLDAARAHPDVVCGVHLGIVRGVLEHLGADSGGTALVPFAEPGACLLTVEEPTP